MIAGEGFVRLPTNTAWSADRTLKAFGADALASIPLRSTRPKGARGRNLQSRSAPPAADLNRGGHHPLSGARWSLRIPVPPLDDLRHVSTRGLLSHCRLSR